MAAGECWIFDTWREHNVVNDASRSRIHLVVDTVGGATFWDHVARGRRHDDVDPNWSPAFIAPDGAAVDLACERYNIPQVMTPWEIHYRLHGLLDEVEPSNPLLPAARAASDAFARDWRALWAQHGDSGEGRADYQATLERFITGLPDAVAGLPLRNGTRWVLARVRITLSLSGKYRAPPAAVAAINKTKSPGLPLIADLLLALAHSQ